VPAVEGVYRVSFRDESVEDLLLGCSELSEDDDSPHLDVVTGFFDDIQESFLFGHGIDLIDQI